MPAMTVCLSADGKGLIQRGRALQVLNPGFVHQVCETPPGRGSNANLHLVLSPLCDRNGYQCLPCPTHR